MNMIETVQSHFPGQSAQLQKEYDSWLEYYTREQQALAKARQKHRDNGSARTGGGKVYIEEIRQDAKLLGKLPGEKDIIAEMRARANPELPFKLKPYEHQMQMLKAGLIRDKLAYFCEMGTGKTKVIVDIIRHKCHGIKAIVFCPKSVLGSWGKEIDKNSNLKYNICTGNRKQKLKLLTDPDADVVITNYETVVSFGADPGLWGLFQMVVLDESSRIKNHKAKRTKLLTQAFASTRFKYILSGTPITQNPADIWAQMNFLDWKMLGNKSYYAFRNTYCIMGGYEKYQIVGYKQLDKLKRLISGGSVQLTKEECNLNPALPEKVYQVREIDMSEEMAKQYKDMLKESVLELSGKDDVTAPIVLTKLMRLQQILSGQYLDKGRNEKLEELTEIITDAIGYGRQVVVWARFRPSLDIISSRLAGLNIPHSIFHGDTQDRQLQIDNFQTGKTKVFVGQESTGGMGITLHAGSVMVYYENEFSLETRKQSEDRIHRIGQTKKCTYIDLVYNKTLDRKILKAIQDKQDIATYLVDSFKEGVYANRK